MKSLKNYIADFGNYTPEQMIKKINKMNVTIPEEWIVDHEGFVVVMDYNEGLELGFYNFDTEDVVGDTFMVNRDEVTCWA